MRGGDFVSAVLLKKIGDPRAAAAAANRAQRDLGTHLRPARQSRLHDAECHGRAAGPSQESAAIQAAAPFLRTSLG